MYVIPLLKKSYLGMLYLKVLNPFNIQFWSKDTICSIVLNNKGALFKKNIA